MTPIESAARALSQDYWAGKCNAEQLAAYVDRTWPRYVGRVRLVLEAVREASRDPTTNEIDRLKALKGEAI